MGKRILILTCLMALNLATNLFAQRLTYAQSDKETYELYISGNWEKLIQKGKEALRNGIDYYYLRVRMGIAYYYLGKYNLAIKHLRKAHKTNPNDPIVNEFLLYSHLAMGDLERAFFHYQSLPEHRKTAIPLFNSKLYRLDINALNFFNLDYSTQASEVANPVELDKNAFGLFGGYNLSLSRKTYLYQMFFFQRSVSTQWDLSSNRPTGGMGFGYGGSANNNQTFYPSTVLTYNLRILTIARVLATRTVSMSLSNNLGFYDGKVLASLGTSILSQFSLFSLGIRADYLYYNTSSTLHLGTYIVLFPLASDKLYFRIEPVVTKTLPLNSFTNLITRVEVGFRIKKTYVSTGYYFGSIGNYLEDNGYFVYATNRFISNQKFLNVLFVGRKVSFYTTILHSKYDGVTTPIYNGLLIRTGLIFNLWNSNPKIKKP
ncbi:MAG: tetratricopeptide repeat protein [Chlorobi bacterium]|nr:tetratricopeptide repeat protein [Chlorobiota bacterium]